MFSGGGIGRYRKRSVAHVHQLLTTCSLFVYLHLTKLKIFFRNLVLATLFNPCEAQ